MITTSFSRFSLILLSGFAFLLSSLDLTRADADEVAIIETTKGPLIVEFWPDVAPKTVESFKKLAKEGYFDGTAFHRIIAGFMAQGGDPLTKDPSREAEWGTGGPGYRLPAEFNDRPHERGVLSMARTNDPNSAGSQFFLMFGRAPHLDGQYTAFGRMIAGESTLAAIEATPVTVGASGEPSKPLERIQVRSVRVVPRSEALAKKVQN